VTVVFTVGVIVRVATPATKGTKFSMSEVLWLDITGATIGVVTPPAVTENVTVPLRKLPTLPPED
jgi:hypothetical protein